MAPKCTQCDPINKMLSMDAPLASKCEGKGGHVGNVVVSCPHFKKTMENMLTEPRTT